MDYEPPGISTAVVPFALGLGTFAAIVLTDGTEDLSLVRFLIATVAWGVVSWCAGYVMVRVLLPRRLARQDAPHREAVAASFRMEMERLGVPLPTDRTTEQ